VLTAEVGKVDGLWSAWKRKRFSQQKHPSIRSGVGGEDPGLLEWLLSG